MELLILSASHIFIHWCSSIVIFDGGWIKIISPQISSCIKVCSLEKNISHQFIIFIVMFLVGYYNESTVVQRQIISQLLFKVNSVNQYIFRIIDQFSMLMVLNILSFFKLDFDCTDALFYKITINIYGVYAV